MQTASRAGTATDMAQDTRHYSRAERTGASRVLAGERTVRDCGQCEVSQEEGRPL
jgi:hypothetical protein